MNVSAYAYLKIILDLFCARCAGIFIPTAIIISISPEQKSWVKFSIPLFLCVQFVQPVTHM